MADRPDRLDASKSVSDAALIALYERLVARAAPQPGSFSALSDAERREYFTIARRRSRKRAREAQEAGRLEPNLANIRAALADAALMILATGAPGVDQVRIVLGAAFAARPGVPMSVERRARSGKLRPKLVGRPS